MLLLGTVANVISEEDSNANCNDCNEPVDKKHKADAPEETKESRTPVKKLKGRAKAGSRLCREQKAREIDRSVHEKKEHCHDGRDKIEIAQKARQSCSHRGDEQRALGSGSNCLADSGNVFAVVILVTLSLPLLILIAIDLTAIAGLDGCCMCCGVKSASSPLHRSTHMVLVVVFVIAVVAITMLSPVSTELQVIAFALCVG